MTTSAAWWFFRAVWAGYLKRTLDTVPCEYFAARSELRTAYYGLAWNEAYDLVEFIAGLDLGSSRAPFVDGADAILVCESAGYRLIDGQVAPLVAESEVAAIETAAGNTACGGAAQHVRKALVLLSQRPDPDLRNSVKESISAVESAAKFIANDDKADLSKALKAVSDKIGMHGALEKGLLCIYGYTSDEDGIRHGMVDEPKLTVADARFMLVACSAFVNYLIEKGLEAGLIPRTA